VEVDAHRNPLFISVAGDSVATFGALAVTGASMIRPIGAVVSVAALAAKHGVAAAARKGKEVRQQNAATAASKEGGGDPLASNHRIILERDRMVGRIQ